MKNLVEVNMSDTIKWQQEIITLNNIIKKVLSIPIHTNLLS